MNNELNNKTEQTQSQLNAQALNAEMSKQEQVVDTFDYDAPVERTVNTEPYAESETLVGLREQLTKFKVEPAYELQGQVSDKPLAFALTYINALDLNMEVHKLEVTDIKRLAPVPIPALVSELPAELVIHIKKVLGAEYFESITQQESRISRLSKLESIKHRDDSHVSVVEDFTFVEDTIFSVMVRRNEVHADKHISNEPLLKFTSANARRVNTYITKVQSILAKVEADKEQAQEQADALEETNTKFKLGSALRTRAVNDAVSKYLNETFVKYAADTKDKKLGLSEEEFLANKDYFLSDEATKNVAKLVYDLVEVLGSVKAIKAAIRAGTDYTQESDPLFDGDWLVSSFHAACMDALSVGGLRKYMYVAPKAEPKTPEKLDYKVVGVFANAMNYRSGSDTEATYYKEVKLEDGSTQRFGTGLSKAEAEALVPFAEEVTAKQELENSLDNLMQKYDALKAREQEALDAKSVVEALAK